MRACRTFAALIAAVGVAAMPPPAGAHGPCDCLEPRTGPPGTRVRVAYPIYKVIFNPDRADLGIGPASLWRAHRDGPPQTIYRRTWRYRASGSAPGGTVTVPRVTPGRYLLALYDGGEGGQHYTWETFTVTADARRTADGDGDRDGDGVPPAAVAAAAAVALACGYGLGARRRRRA